MVVHSFVFITNIVLLTVFLTSPGLMDIPTSLHQSPPFNTVDSVHQSLLRALSHLCQARLKYMQILVMGSDQ